jgi:uncharacterized membrane protein
VVFPLGLLSTAVFFDIIYLVTDRAIWTQAAFFMIGAGVLLGLGAAAPGWVDWAGIPKATRAKRIGLIHGVGNVLVLGLFLLSWILRRPTPEAPPTEAIVAALGGAVVAVVTAWLGGELVARLGVGVDDGAHLDAPSSLTAQPAAGSSRAGARAPDRRAHPWPAYHGVERRMAGAAR